MSREDTQDFLPLFLNDVPFIDTRAPIEFEKGSLPTSVNLPLMTNEERAEVGTCYKQKGQQAAIELGHKIVSGSVKDQRVAAWVQFAKQYPQGVLFCWRGGMRSKICQQWMRDAGVDYPRIIGGYKAMRRFLINEFERLCADQPLLLLGGRTGCNKTAFVAELSHAVDLEALASHRGSSFGRLPQGQPSQLNFENALGVAMLKAERGAAEKGLPILLEDEGRMVGRCAMPEPLQQAMASCPIVVLEIPLDERIEHSYRNYILNKLDEWIQQVGEEAAFEAFDDDLTQSLFRVRKRLGGTRYAEINALLQKALESHRSGNPDLHRDWMQRLLVDYYDPMYDYQIGKRAERVVFRGDRTAVREYLTANRT